MPSVMDDPILQKLADSDADPDVIRTCRSKRLRSWGDSFVFVVDKDPLRRLGVVEGDNLVVDAVEADPEIYATSDEIVVAYRFPNLGAVDREELPDRVSTQVDLRALRAD